MTEVVLLTSLILGPKAIFEIYIYLSDRLDRLGRVDSERLNEGPG